MPGVTRFPLAPMSGAIRALTGLALAVPLLLLGIGALIPQAGILLASGALVALLYVAVWLYWRPSAFEVDPVGLAIHFPRRVRRSAASDISGAREIDGAEFRSRYGFAMRVGVGGLWGGFGWLWTHRGAWVEFYVSRSDGLVLVERRAAAPLLVSPEDPAGFARAISQLSG